MKLSPFIQKRVLLLSSRPDIYRSVEKALETAGCKIVDDFDAYMDFDVLMIDGFFIHAGMMRLISAERWNGPVIYLKHDSEELQPENEKLFDRVELCGDKPEALFESWMGEMSYLFKSRIRRIAGSLHANNAS